MTSDIVAELADREAIRDCLTRSALGSDMLDPALMKSAFWPDATNSNLPLFSGNAHEFVDLVMPLVSSTIDTTVHYVTNSVIRLEGLRARGLACVFVYCRYRMTDEQPAWDLFAGARYIDLYEKRGAEWRILERTAKVDWKREETNSLDWSRPDPATGVPLPLGMHRADDPINQLFSGRASESLAAPVLAMPSA